MDRPNQTRPAYKIRMTRKQAAAFAACSVAGFTACSGVQSVHADALAMKGDTYLAHLKQNKGSAQVIMSVNGSLTPANRAQIGALGGVIVRDLSFIHADAVRLPVRNLNRLASFSFVRHLAQDGVVKKCDEFTVNSSLDNAAFQQYGMTGYGVTVAVVDSGIHAQAQDLQYPPASVLATFGVTTSSPAPPTPPTPPTPGAPPALPKPPAHLPVGSRVIDGINFVAGPNGVVNPNATDDTCGHGTHVAGIIAGDGAASTGPQDFQTYYGIAPLANLVAVRVLDQNGAGTVDTVLAGIQWVIQNEAKDNIRVMNLSLGHPMTDSYVNDPLCQAVEAAWKAGIVVVCAAGNDGRLNTTSTSGAPNEGWGTAYGSIQSPADDPYVITVGAMKKEDSNRNDDLIATYSSRGPTLGDATLKPDIVAPGNQVISIAVAGSTLDTEFNGTNQIPLSDYQYTNGPQQSTQTSNNYFCLSGTSMASPVVAAAAALMLQQNTALSPDTIKVRLMESADKWRFPGGVADPCTFGAGYLDIPAAMASTAVVPAGTYALSPELVLDNQGNVDIAMDPSVYGSRAVWGVNGIWNTGITDLRMIWGSSAVEGSGALNESTDIFSSSTLASSQEIAANRALWGCSSLTASRALWGCSVPSVDLSATALNGEE